MRSGVARHKRADTILFVMKGRWGKSGLDKGKRASISPQNAQLSKVFVREVWQPSLIKSAAISMPDLSI